MKFKHQKLLLIVAISAVIYLLFLRWNDTQQEQIKQIAAAQPKTKTQIPENTAPVPNNPQSTDIPSTTDYTPNPQSEKIKKDSNKTKNNNYITVTTDVMKITIDLNGGDLVANDLLKHKTSLEDKSAFKLLENGKNTYVVSSGFIGADGIDNRKGRATYTADKTNYNLNDDENLTVTLTHSTDKSLITKVLHFKRGSYEIIQDFNIINKQAKPLHMAVYTHIKRGTFADSSPDVGIGGVNSYLGAVISTQEDSYEKVTFDDMKDANISLSTKEGWVAMLQHYFVTAIVPPQDKTYQFYSIFSNQQQAIIGYKSDLLEVAGNNSLKISTKVYSGPKIKSNLEPVQEKLSLTIDYGWFWIISELLIWLLLKLQLVFVNWGVSIIMLTVIVRLVFFWPTKKAFHSMAKMRLAMPQITAIKERVGSDKQALSKEMMEFYKKEKLNPLGGCLPMLLQMPVFIALYWGLMESVELRHAPFMLWITDLSAGDSYFVLPILMGITFYLQQRLNPQAATMDPTMRKVMQYMPILFTFLFLWLPSGLVLYFVTSNGWSIIQQYIITKQLEKKQK